MYAKVSSTMKTKDISVGGGEEALFKAVITMQF